MLDFDGKITLLDNKQTSEHWQEKSEKPINKKLAENDDFEDDDIPF